MASCLGNDDLLKLAISHLFFVLSSAVPSEVIMKRATQRGSASPQQGPQAKKLRLDETEQKVDDYSEFQEPSAIHDMTALAMKVNKMGSSSVEDSGEGWTKVERRKMKKMRNYEIKLSVRTTFVIALRGSFLSCGFICFA